MPAMFSVHMSAHMLLSMLVPVLLVLGAPVTLALRALPAAGRNDPPGMREWLLAALHSRVSQFLTNPIVALVLFVAGFYGLYFGGLFDAAASSHAAHVAMNVHFLLSGIRLKKSRLISRFTYACLSFASISSSGWLPAPLSLTIWAVSRPAW